MSPVLLNVADVRLRSRANGPGLRSVVWVQGCALGCPGCLNPHTHPHVKRRLIDPEELASILRGVRDTSGITISGGEPFQQAQACALLAQKVREAGQSIMVFSGYSYEYLCKCRLTAVQSLLGNIDLLVAGSYIQHLRGDGSLWRASTNQTVHLLSDRLASFLEEPAVSTPAIEIVSDGRASMTTGLPGDQDLAWLNQVFAGGSSQLGT